MSLYSRSTFLKTYMLSFIVIDHVKPPYLLCVTVAVVDGVRSEIEISMTVTKR